MGRLDQRTEDIQKGDDATFRAGAPWAPSPDTVLLDVTPKVWHELRMTGYPNALVAYCPCGWAVADSTWSSDMGEFRESYQDHLG